MIKDNQFNKTLLSIIEENKDTEYGRRYHFSNLRTVDGYRYCVPLTKIEDVKPLIELTTRIGEHKIYAWDKLIAYALTSGTSEINHFVPCTQRHISDYVKEFEKLISHTRGDSVLLFESIPQKIVYSDMAQLDTVSGIILQSLRHKIKRYRLTSPEALLFRNDTADVSYYRALFAVADENVTQIIAPFSWGVFSFVQCIIRNRERLINDLESGRISFDGAISEALKTKLQGSFKANPKRARELKAILDSGDCTDLLPRIWKRLRRVVAAGTGRFRIYKDNLKKYLGDVTYSNGYFASSEAIMGVAVGDTDIYRMYEKNAYIEFKPLGEEGNETVLFDEVEVGKLYVIYITNHAGLYRYRVGDIVEITDIKDGIPYFRYIGRTNEKIHESAIYHCIQRLSAISSSPVYDYCFEQNEDGSITLYIESEASDSTANCDLPDELSDRLHIDSIKQLPVGTQEEYRILRGNRGNMAADQLKPIRSLNTEEKREFFKPKAK